MTQNTDRPDDFDWVSDLVRGALGAMRIIGAGVVQSYDPNDQRVSISFVTDWRRINPLTQEIETYRPPTVHNCPVLNMHGNDFFVSMPVQEGDYGIVLTSDRSLDEWLLNGGASVTPLDPRRFDETDSMFLPAGRPFADPLENVDARGESMVIGDSRDTGVRLKFNPDGTFRLGNSAVDLIDQISELADKLASTASDAGTSVVPTSSGPKPLSNAASLISLSVQASAIKALVDQLKES